MFVTTLPATALGVLMTLAATSWYAPYGSGTDAVRDQQIAGAIMWGFGGLATVIAAAATLRRLAWRGWTAPTPQSDARSAVKR